MTKTLFFLKNLSAVDENCLRNLMSKEEAEGGGVGREEGTEGGEERKRKGRRRKRWGNRRV